MYVHTNYVLTSLVSEKSRIISTLQCTSVICLQNFREINQRNGGVSYDKVRENIPQSQC